jgi:hypothetical protein
MSMLHFVFEDDYVICELDDSLPVLKHRWKKEPTGQHFRETLLKILEHYKSFGNKYRDLAWLADTQQLGELDRETEKWLADVWDDKLFGKGGVKFHAVILGDDLFAEYAMEKFKMEAEEKRGRDVQLGVFVDEEEPYDWIRTR